MIPIPNCILKYLQFTTMEFLRLLVFGCASNCDDLCTATGHSCNNLPGCSSLCDLVLHDL